MPNPKTPRRLTRKLFEAWLEKQPARRMFGTGYTTMNGEPFCPLGHWCGNPMNSDGLAWRRAFVAAVDSAAGAIPNQCKGRRISATYALKILRALP